MDAKSTPRLAVLAVGVLLAVVSAAALAGPVVTSVNLASSVAVNGTQTQNTYTLTV